MHRPNTPSPSPSPSTLTFKQSRTFASTAEPGKGRGPVSWTMLGVVGVAAAAAVAYYRVERERRLEKALGTIVSSESGWSPGPSWANRVYKNTKFGWYPVQEPFSSCEFALQVCFVGLFCMFALLCFALKSILLSTQHLGRFV